MSTQPNEGALKAAPSQWRNVKDTANEILTGLPTHLGLARGKVAFIAATAEREIQREAVNPAVAELVDGLDDCRRAFGCWQVGQIPGRPEDILALIAKVDALLAKYEAKGGAS